MSMQFRRSERGLALVTVLLMVAVITTLAALMLEKTSLKVTELSLATQQPRMQAAVMSAEARALKLLSERVTEEPFAKSDELYEIQGPFEQNGLSYKLRVVDLSGRLPLNNLSLDKQYASLWRTRLKRLLLSLELDPELANQIEDLQYLGGAPLVDSAEGDEAAGEGGEGGDGAEGSGGEVEAQALAALGDEQSIQPLVSLYELTRIEGVSAETVRLLAPHVSVLPVSTRLNVNQVEAGLGAALELSEAPESGFASLSDAGAGAEESQGLSLSSDVFVVVTEVSLGSADQKRYAFSLLARQSTGALTAGSNAAGFAVVTRYLGGPDLFNVLSPIQDPNPN